MAKVKKLSWSEVGRIGKTVVHPVVRHLKKYGAVYAQIIIYAGVIFFSPSDVFAAGSLDASGNAIYKKIIGIGKWVIIIKGGIDTIQNVMGGDFDSAKKSFLGYLMVYGVLFALPWGMEQIETVFSGL